MGLRRAGVPYATGMAATAAGLAVFLTLRLVLGPWGLPGLAAAEWFGLLLVPFLLLRRWRLTPRSALPPVRPGWMDVVAGTLVGAGALPLAWAVLAWTAMVIPPDPESSAALREVLLRPRDTAGLTGLVFLAVVTPAVCEEVAFRGLFLTALAKRWPGPAAVAFSAGVFALLHWMPGGTARIAPAAVLGLLLGWVVWRRGSLLAAMAGHLVYNGLVVAMARTGGPMESGGWSVTPETPSALFLVVGVAFVAGGLHLPSRDLPP